MVANTEAKWQCLAFPKDFTPATDEIRRIPQLGLLISEVKRHAGGRKPGHQHRQQSLPKGQIWRDVSHTDSFILIILSCPYTPPFRPYLLYPPDLLPFCLPLEKSGLLRHNNQTRQNNIPVLDNGKKCN